jgi:hypothetical protein
VAAAGTVAAAVIVAVADIAVAVDTTAVAAAAFMAAQLVVVAAADSTAVVAAAGSTVAVVVTAAAMAAAEAITKSPIDPSSGEDRNSVFAVSLSDAELCTVFAPPRSKIFLTKAFRPHRNAEADICPRNSE